LSCQPHAQPLTWRIRLSLFVWVITVNLSGMGGPTSTIRYRQHSSWVHMTTQAPPVRQSCDTFGGGGGRFSEPTEPKLPDSVFQQNLNSPRYLYIQFHRNSTVNGFHDLEVASWPLVPKFADSHPAETVGFLGRKNFSARLPSEGK